MNADDLLRRHPYLADHADRCRSVLVFYPVMRLLSRFYGDDIAEGNRGFTVAMAILAHVCECMLTGRGGATHRELLDALTPLVLGQARAEGREMGRGEAEALVARVLNELQNSGEIFRTEFFDYASGRTVTHAFRILEAEASRERGAYKLKLTPDGIDLFFRLKEVYGALDTDMERLFLEHQVKRGCYAEAGRVVDTLLLKITRAQEQHRELRGKLRSNPGEVSADEVAYFGEVVADRLREEKEHFARIRDLIDGQMRTLLRQVRRKGPADPAIRESLAALRDLQAGTARIVDRHNVLFGLNTELRREFRGLKLGLLTFAPTLRRLPVETEVFDPVLRKGPGLDEVHRFLGPLLGPRRPRWFHLAHAFPPPPRNRDVPGEAFLADPWADPEWADRERRRTQRLVGHLRAVLSYLWSPPDGRGDLAGLAAHDVPARPVVDDTGRVVAEEPVCLMDMDAAEVRAFLRFLLWLHNRGRVSLRGAETREAFDRLTAEEPAWAEAEEVRVWALSGWAQVGDNRVRHLGFEVVRADTTGKGEAVEA